MSECASKLRLLHDFQASSGHWNIEPSRSSARMEETVCVCVQRQVITVEVFFFFCIGLNVWTIVCCCSHLCVSVARRIRQSCDKGVSH